MAAARPPKGADARMKDEEAAVRGWGARLSRRALLGGVGLSGAAAAAWRLGGARGWGAFAGPARASAQAIAGAGDTIVTYHYSNQRWGWRAAPLPVNGFQRLGSIELGSSVRAQPLYVENYTPANGPNAGVPFNLLLVATSADTVYAFDKDQLLAGSQQPLWTASLGTATNRNGGYLYPEAGIQSTPIIDLDRRQVYLMVMLNDGSGTFAQPHASYYHHVLDLDTGNVISATLLADAGAPNRPTFVGNDQNNRGALTLVNGRIYSVYSDFLEADAGPYHGWIVSIAQDDPTDQQFWSVNTTPELLGGGIWGQGGVVADPAGNLFTTTGNMPVDYPDYFAAIPPGKYPADLGDYFMSALRLQATPGGLQVVDWFTPGQARVQSAQDYDLSDSSPLILPTINGRDLMTFSPKDGNVYLLDRNNLGHWDKPLRQYPTFVGGPDGGGRSSPAYMQAPNGDHLVFIAGIGSPSFVCFKVVTDGGQPALQKVWDVPASLTSFGDAPGSPVITGSGTDATVWVVDNGFDPASGVDNHPAVLYGFNALTGAVVYASANNPNDDLGKVPHFAVTTPVGGVLLVGGWTNLQWFGGS